MGGLPFFEEEASLRGDIELQLRKKDIWCSFMNYGLESSIEIMPSPPPTWAQSGRGNFGHVDRVGKVGI